MCPTTTDDYENFYYVSLLPHVATVAIRTWPGSTIVRILPRGLLLLALPVAWLRVVNPSWRPG